MTRRICPGCRKLDGVHHFGPSCTLIKDAQVEPVPGSRWNDTRLSPDGFGVITVTRVDGGMVYFDDKIAVYAMVLKDFLITFDPFGEQGPADEEDDVLR